MANEKKTLIEDGTSFRGSLTSTVPIAVNGRLEGEVEAPSLTVSQSGAVHGKVKVDELTSMGELAGEIEATRVKLSGSVKDNTKLAAQTLEVQLSAEGKMNVFFGDCELTVGDDPRRD